MNDSINQLRDLFRSMTPAARITSALLLGVIVVSLGYLFQQRGNGANHYLFGGEILNQREADRVQAAISKAGLKGAVREGGRIRVPSGEKEKFIAAVADDGALPANFDTLMAEALNGSPFDSRPVQQQRIKAVLQRQLSMIVSNMDGVEHADVLYDVQKSRGFQKGAVSATVSVRPAAGEQLTPKRAKAIRAAVAGGIAGLSPNDVNLLNLADGSTSFAGHEITPEEFDDPYYQTRSRYEQLMQGRIVDLLHYIPGIRVQVSADLDNTLSVTKRVVTSDGDAVLIRENNDSETVTNRRVEGGQRPGPTAQGPNASLPDENSALVVSETTITDIDNDFFPPTTEEEMKLSGLVPQDVRVAVAIPTEYAQRVWREQSPDAGPDERPTTDDLVRIQETTKTDIQSVVKPLLPEQLNKEDYKVIQVSFFQTLTPDDVEGPSVASEALFWAGRNANTLLTAGFALVGLVMLRSMVKATPPADPASPYGAAALALELPDGDEADETDDDEPENDGRPRLKLKKGSSLRDELADIVREDPDTAAAILRTWINKAA